MSELPSGTVTFLFTDVEGSTRLLREHGDGYAELLAAHRTAIRATVAANGGVAVARRATRCSLRSRGRPTQLPSPAMSRRRSRALRRRTMTGPQEVRGVPPDAAWRGRGPSGAARMTRTGSVAVRSKPGCRSRIVVRPWPRVFRSGGPGR